MRTSPHLRSGLSATALLVAACQGPTGPPAVGPSPVTVLQAQERAWNQGDLDSFMSLGYWRSPELSFFSGGTWRRGYDEVLERYRANYQGAGKEMGRLHFHDVQALPLGLDHALVRGRWSLQYADGTSFEGLFTLLFRRFPEGWRIVHDHTSVASPASGP